jgi:FlaA1/EpsC-like NDP-sugar epimerase
MGTQTNKFIYWVPRILSVIFMCFLALFSLDVISPGLSFWQIVIGLFIHNVPVFILSAVLVISWKYEIVGGIAYILAGILYTAIILVNMLRSSFEWYMISWILMIAGPAFLIGALFIMGWIKKQNTRKDKGSSSPIQSI